MKRPVCFIPYEEMYVEHLVYPQYEKYYRTIPRDVWEQARTEVFECLAKQRDRAAPEVLRHWEMIASGTLPYGLRIREDSK